VFPVSFSLHIHERRQVLDSEIMRSKQSYIDGRGTSSRVNTDTQNDRKDNGRVEQGSDGMNPGSMRVSKEIHHFN